MAVVAPYGSWRSPLVADLLVEAAVGLSSVGTVAGRLAWVESRPSEGGRMVLVALGEDGEPHDVIPRGFSVRSSLHEYGGRCWAPLEDGAVFANWEDQRLYRVLPGTGPEAITPAPETPRSIRYADIAVSSDGRWLAAARERHHGAGSHQVDNDIVAVSLTGPFPTEAVPLAGGHDFAAAPRISPGGRQLAWITWDHPDMPWDRTELWVGHLPPDPTGGRGLTGVQRVAGGDGAARGESVTQPRWSPDGRLHYISDRSGWWNLYDEAGSALAPLDEEFAGPDWVVGESSYAFLPDGRLAATWSGGHFGLVAAGQASPIALPYTQYSSVVAVGDAVATVAGSPAEPAAVVVIDPAQAEARVIRRSRPTALDPAYVSVPNAIEFPAAEGRRAHAYWYAPANPDYEGPPGELPPLVVMSHGGPTSAASPVLNYAVQFWTTRGFGVVDVDYGGSSGYGRQYRDLLRGRWGIVDVDDCTAAALWLAGQGLADRDRLAIRGGSAGGYTTLAALAFRDVFATGASHYGVADLELLARDTHKFESRYLDRLVGPYPEAIAVYQERSPIHHLEGFTRPLILFQGLEDAIVPPEQAELMAAALAERGVPVACLAFEGEQHGFRRAATIMRVIVAELAFYGRVFGFTPADSTEPFDIANEAALPPG